MIALLRLLHVSTRPRTRQV